MAKERAGLFALLGLTGLAIGGAALASASRGPSRVEIGPERRVPPDWSGCGEPPDYIKQIPQFKCQEWVERAPDKAGIPTRFTIPKDELLSGPYLVVGRTWGPTPDNADAPIAEASIPTYGKKLGQWNYDLLDSKGQSIPLIIPETWIKRAATQPSAEVSKKVAAVLAPTATPVAKPAVKAIVAPVTAKQEAAMNLPLYPQGLTVSKGSVKGTVISIGKRDGSYQYKVEAGIGFITQDYTGSESYVMNMLAEKTGQQAYGFAFPAGVTLQMKKLKVAIKERKLDDGKMSYVTDTLGVISEPELILKLYQAQKG